MSSLDLSSSSCTLTAGTTFVRKCEFKERIFLICLRQQKRLRWLCIRVCESAGWDLNFSSQVSFKNWVIIHIRSSNNLHLIKFSCFLYREIPQRWSSCKGIIKHFRHKQIALKRILSENKSKWCELILRKIHYCDEMCCSLFVGVRCTRVSRFFNSYSTNIFHIHSHLKLFPFAGVIMLRVNIWMSAYCEDACKGGISWVNFLFELHNFLQTFVFK